jgi:hypothetical protein
VVIDLILLTTKVDPNPREIRFNPTISDQTFNISLQLGKSRRPAHLKQWNRNSQNTHSMLLKCSQICPQ